MAVTADCFSQKGLATKTEYTKSTANCQLLFSIVNQCLLRYPETPSFVAFIASLPFVQFAGHTSPNSSKCCKASTIRIASSTLSRLAPELLGSIAVAAYSYMALVPVIQPPIMKALTSKKERTVVMKQLRTVTKTEKIIFPIMVTIIVSLIVPDAAVLVGMLMLGNLMKECGVVDRIQNWGHRPSTSTLMP